MNSQYGTSCIQSIRDIMSIRDIKSIRDINDDDDDISTAKRKTERDSTV